ncbi:MAG: alpha/beta hydrolase [Pseudomonadota bacterium]
MRALSFLVWRRKAPDNLQVVDQTIPVRDGQIAVRMYTPDLQGPFPTIVYFHGGGFVLGSLETVDGACRDLCSSSGHGVISVDYRLAPEAPFPAAPNDCLDALNWVHHNAQSLAVDASRLYVAGDSAGGNLAAVTALQMRDSNPELIRGQILLYPVTHHYSYNTPSYSENAKGQGLTRNMMVWFWDLYYGGSAALADGQWTHPLSTPLAVDNLADLPPALVLTAELDPLRDEGVEYAERLSSCGVPVQHTLYACAQHGFIGTMGPTETHRRGIKEIVRWLDSQQTGAAI